MSNPLILGTNSIKDTGYEVANSVRFENDANSDSFSRDMVTATSRKTFTVSMWLKKVKNNFGSEQYLFHSWQDSNNRFISSFDSSNILHIRNRTGGSNTLKFNTNQKFLDVSAWYNIIIAIDTTQSTESNRFKLYVNGTQVTSFSTSDYPSQNADMSLGTSDFDNILGIYGGGGNGFSGYMCEMVYIDGLQLDPTSFGEFDSDTNIWKPKDVSGLTFGSEGFYLDFENANSLGADVSGNGNNFTVNNLTSIDQTTDTCTNNWCTLNPLRGSSYNVTFSEGNLKSSCSLTNNDSSMGTIAVSSGKWYFEVKMTSLGSGNQVLGFREYGGTSYKQNEDGTDTNLTAGATAPNGFSTGDIVGVALDLDSATKTIQYYINGSADGDALSLDSYNGEPIAPLGGNDVYTMEWNFGNPPYSISSGNSDGNGYGNFEYAVPSGYYALNTKNLSEYG